MTYQPKILAFAGSLRKDSFNKKLIAIAIKGALDAGASVTHIDLKNYPLPVYDQDIEDASGIPENALKIKELMYTHDGFLLSLPEYNSSMSCAFKNVIDWVSRPSAKNEVYLGCFTDKAVALLSTSVGPLGGMRGLVHARAMFGAINSIVLPKQKSIPLADSAFLPDGSLKDPKQQQDAQEIGKALATFLTRYKG